MKYARAGEAHETLPDAAAESARMGTGLSWWDLVGLTVLSTALFVVYPTILWKAGPAASHVGRFLVSYLAVIPLTAGLLYYRLRRVPVRELIAAVLIVWSIKMLVTFGLYHAFATRTRLDLEPPTAPDHFVKSERRPYQGRAGFVGVALDGRVLGRASTRLSRAIVYLEDVAEGALLPDPRSTPPAEIRVRGDGIEPRLSVVPIGSEILLANDAGATVVLAGDIQGRTAFNVPVVPGDAGRRVRMNRPGLVHFAPRVGPASGQAWVQVVDNPYFARVAADGSFSLRDVPAAGVTIVGLNISADGERWTGRVHFDAAQARDVTLQLEAGGPAGGAARRGEGS